MDSKELLKKAKEMERTQHGNTWDNAIESFEKRHRQATMDAKKYALACCDEVIMQESFWINNTKKGNSNFWKQVKKELKRM